MEYVAKLAHEGTSSLLEGILVLNNYASSEQEDCPE